MCKNHTKRNHRGFTLIELLIVVAIIANLAAVAIPIFIRARMDANESSAATSVRQIATAQEAFRAAGFADANSDGAGDYGTLVQLGNPDNAGATEPFIDAVLASGLKSGYTFVVNPVAGGPGTVTQYECFAVPVSPGQTGFKQFFVDDTTVIRQTQDGTAVGPTSPPLD